MINTYLSRLNDDIINLKMASARCFFCILLSEGEVAALMVELYSSVLILWPKTNCRRFGIVWESMYLYSPSVSPSKLLHVSNNSALERILVKLNWLVKYDSSRINLRFYHY